MCRIDHEPSGYCTRCDLELFHGNKVCPECGEIVEDDGVDSPDMVSDEIQNLIDSHLDEMWTGKAEYIRTDSFKEAGVLTKDSGFVIAIDGNKFQITVVKCRR